MQIVELKEGFEICGLKIRTDNASEMNGEGRIADLWREFLNSGYNGTDEICAVYHEYESDLNGSYSLLVGTKGSPRGVYEKVIAKAGKYAVFSKEGAGENTVIELWREIWEFFENSNLKRAYVTDFEKYLKDKIEIYVSIK
ncbi:effector binding domain-containing protein [Campylobacter sp. RM16188]|uniref:GyrI-like domain-containing protein n=1 Tax=Campylobacter sp. RM16188 TaxID=1705725 RepID=UPI001553AEEC